MKKNNLLYILMFLSLILLILGLPTAYCEPVWINKSSGLAGYEFTCITADKQNPNIVYMGSSGFLLKSTDKGKNWQNVFMVPGVSKKVNQIAIDSSDCKIVYIATDCGIYRSQDEGVNWASLKGSVKEDGILTILIDSQNSKVLFAGTERTVYKSQDSGRSWSKSAIGILDTAINSLAQNPQNPKILFASSGKGLFKSLDHGNSWREVFFTNSAVEYSEIYPEKYTDEGVNTATQTYVALDLDAPSTVYLSTPRGMFKSVDSGASWERVAKLGFTGGVIRNFIVSSNSKCLFVSTKKGVFRYSARDNAWQILDTGMIKPDIKYMSFAPDEISIWAITKDFIYSTEGTLDEPEKNTANNNFEHLLRNFTNEPHFRKVQEAAIEYAEVQPEKIARWRRAAKVKAFLPKVSFGIDNDYSDELHWDAGTNPDTLVIGPNDKSTGWDVTCSWDLGELVWNSDQTTIDSRSKLMVELRDDILDEVTRLYFERRRLQIELMQNPPKDPNKRIEKQLRIEELTANIDALTGGYFSRELEYRKTR